MFICFFSWHIKYSKCACQRVKKPHLLEAPLETQSSKPSGEREKIIFIYECSIKYTPNVISHIRIKIAKLKDVDIIFPYYISYHILYYE